jgi:hypothetical protein
MGGGILFLPGAIHDDIIGKSGAALPDEAGAELGIAHGDGVKVGRLKVEIREAEMRYDVAPMSKRGRW